MSLKDLSSVLNTSDWEALSMDDQVLAVTGAYRGEIDAATDPERQKSLYNDFREARKIVARDKALARLGDKAPLQVRAYTEFLETDEMLRNPNYRPPEGLLVKETAGEGVVRTDAGTLKSKPVPGGSDANDAIGQASGLPSTDPALGIRHLESVELLTGQDFGSEKLRKQLAELGPTSFAPDDLTKTFADPNFQKARQRAMEENSDLGAVVNFSQPEPTEFTAWGKTGVEIRKKPVPGADWEVKFPDGSVETLKAKKERTTFRARSFIEGEAAALGQAFTDIASGKAFRPNKPDEQGRTGSQREDAARNKAVEEQSYEPYSVRDTPDIAPRQLIDFVGKRSSKLGDDLRQEFEKQYGSYDVGSFRNVLLSAPIRGVMQSVEGVGGTVQQMQRAGAIASGANPADDTMASQFARGATEAAEGVRNNLAPKKADAGALESSLATITEAGTGLIVDMLAAKGAGRIASVGFGATAPMAAQVGKAGFAASSSMKILGSTYNEAFTAQRMQNKSLREAHDLAAKEAQSVALVTAILERAGPAEVFANPAAVKAAQGLVRRALVGGAAEGLGEEAPQAVAQVVLQQAFRGDGAADKEVENFSRAFGGDWEALKNSQIIQGAIGGFGAGAVVNALTGGGGEQAPPTTTPSGARVMAAEALASAKATPASAPNTASLNNEELESAANKTLVEESSKSTGQKLREDLANVGSVVPQTPAAPATATTPTDSIPEGEGGVIGLDGNVIPVTEGPAPTLETSDTGVIAAPAPEAAAPATTETPAAEQTDIFTDTREQIASIAETPEAQEAAAQVDDETPDFVAQAIAETQDEADEAIARYEEEMANVARDAQMSDEFADEQATVAEQAEVQAKIDAIRAEAEAPPTINRVLDGNALYTAPPTVPNFPATQDTMAYHVATEEEVKALRNGGRLASKGARTGEGGNAVAWTRGGSNVGFPTAANKGKFVVVTPVENLDKRTKPVFKGDVAQVWQSDGTKWVEVTRDVKKPTDRVPTRAEWSRRIQARRKKQGLRGNPEQRVIRAFHETAVGRYFSGGRGMVSLKEAQRLGLVGDGRSEARWNGAKDLTKNPKLIDALFGGGGERTPDQWAGDMYADGILPDASMDTFWSAIRTAIREAESTVEAEFEADVAENLTEELLTSISKGDPQNDTEVEPDSLARGDVLIIDGRAFTVVTSLGSDLVLKGDGKFERELTLPKAILEGAFVDDVRRGNPADAARPAAPASTPEEQVRRAADTAKKQAEAQKREEAFNAKRKAEQEAKQKAKAEAEAAAKPKAPVTEMDRKADAAKELFADDGGFKLAQQTTQDGDAEAKRKADAAAAKEAADKAQQKLDIETGPRPETPAKLSYEEFKKQYRRAFDSANKYTPDETGSSAFTDKMAELADKYPDFLERFEGELEAETTLTETDARTPDQKLKDALKLVEQVVANTTKGATTITQEAVRDALVDQITKDPDSPAALLYTIASRAASTRGVKRKGERKALAEGNVGTLDTGTPVADPASQPDESVEEDERRERLNEMMQLLSPEEREVMSRALRGQNNRTIADALGLAVETIATTKSRAKAKLQKAAEKVGPVVSMRDYAPPKPFNPSLGTDQELIDAMTDRYMAKFGGSKRPKLKAVTKGLTKAQKKAAEMGAFFGRRVVFVNGLQVNGLFDPETPSVIYIADDAEKPAAVTMYHELLHSLRATDPKAYQRLKTAVKVDLDAYVTANPKKRESSESLTREEFLADFMADRATDPDFWVALAQKDKTLFEKIIELLQSIIRSVRQGRMGTEQFVSDLAAADAAVLEALMTLQLQGENIAAGTKGGLKASKRELSADDKAYLAAAPLSPRLVPPAQDEVDAIQEKFVNTAKREILDDIASGDIPASVRSFEELNDFVDANEYVNDANRENRALGPYGKSKGWKPQDYIEFTNGVIDELNDWLTSGDAAYLAAVEAGDMDTAQRMVDEAAKAAGYLMSHRQAKPVVARKGDVMLFVDNSSVNISYGSHNFAVKDLPEVPTYVKDFAKDYYGEEGQTEPADILESAQAWDDRQFVSDLWQKFENRFLSEGVIGFKTPDGGVVFDRPSALDQNAIKSADPVTYDEQGEIIPLSQRFNPQSDDIRFSRREGDFLMGDDFTSAVQVVEPGKPVRFYRGTTEANTFDPTKDPYAGGEGMDLGPGRYFTEDVRTAQYFSFREDLEDLSQTEEFLLGGKLLRIDQWKKPTKELQTIVEALGSTYDKARWESVLRNFAPYPVLAREAGSKANLRKVLESLGYQGIVDEAPSGLGSSAKQVVVFDQSIATPTGRTGEEMLTPLPTDDDIRFMRRDRDNGDAGTPVQTGGRDNRFFNRGPSHQKVMEDVVRNTFDPDTAPLTNAGIRSAVQFLGKLLDPAYVKSLTERAIREGVPPQEAAIIPGVGRSAVLAYATRLAETNPAAADSLISKVEKAHRDLRFLFSEAIDASIVGKALRSLRAFAGGSIQRMFYEERQGREDFAKEKYGQDVVDAADAVRNADLNAEESEELADKIVSDLDPETQDRITKAEAAAHAAWVKVYGLFKRLIKLKDTMKASRREDDAPESRMSPDEAFRQWEELVLSPNANLEDIAAAFDVLMAVSEADLEAAERDAITRARRTTTDAINAKEEATGTTNTRNQVDILAKRHIGKVTRAKKQNDAEQAKRRQAFQDLVNNKELGFNEFLTEYVRLGGTVEVGSDLYDANIKLLREGKSPAEREADTKARAARRNADELVESLVTKALVPKVEGRRPTADNLTPERVMAQYRNPNITGTPETLAAQLREFTDANGNRLFSEEQVATLVVAGGLARQMRIDARAARLKADAEAKITERTESEKAEAERLAQVAEDRAEREAENLQDLVDTLVGDLLYPRKADTRQTAENDTIRKVLGRFKNLDTGGSTTQLRAELRDLKNGNGTQMLSEDQIDTLATAAEISRESAMKARRAEAQAHLDGQAQAKATKAREKAERDAQALEEEVVQMVLDLVSPTKKAPARPTAENDTPRKLIARATNPDNVRIDNDVLAQMFRDFKNKDGSQRFTEELITALVTATVIARNAKVEAESVKAEEHDRKARAKQRQADVKKGRNIFSPKTRQARDPEKRSLRQIILKDFINNPVRKIMTQAERIEFAKEILREKTDLSEADIDRVAVQMEGQLAAEMERLKLKAMVPFLKSLGNKALSREQIAKAIRLEILDPGKDFISAVAALAGWDGLTDAEYRRLVELQAKIDLAGNTEFAGKDPRSTLAWIKEQERIIYLARGIPPAGKDRVNAYTRGNLYSGLRSLTIGVVQGSVQTGVSVLQEIWPSIKGNHFNPIMAGQEIMVVVEAFLKNIPRGLREALEVAKTDTTFIEQVRLDQAKTDGDKDTGIFTDPLTWRFYDASKKLTEAIQNHRKVVSLNSGKILWQAFRKYVQSAGRFTFRALVMPDAAATKINASAMADIMSFREAKRMGITKAQLREMRREMTRIAEGQRAFLQTELGLSGNILEIEIRDRMEGALLQALSLEGAEGLDTILEEAAADMQDRLGTGKTSKVTIAGNFTEVISTGVNSSKIPLASFLPAVRTNGNIIDASLWYTPVVGLYRAMKYNKATEAERQAVFPNIRSDWQFRRKQNMAVLANGAFFGIVALLLANIDLPDDEKYFWFTGRRPTDPEALRLWEKNKRQEYTLYIGGLPGIQTNRGLGQELFPILLIASMLVESSNGVSGKELLNNAVSLLESFIPGYSQANSLFKNDDGTYEAGRFLESQAALAVPLSALLQTPRRLSEPIDRRNTEANLWEMNPFWVSKDANALTVRNILGESLGTTESPYAWISKIGIPLQFRPIEQGRDPIKRQIMQDFYDYRYGGKHPTLSEFRKKYGEGVPTTQYQAYLQLRADNFVPRYQQARERLTSQPERFSSAVGDLWEVASDRAARTLGLEKQRKKPPTSPSP